MKKSCRDCTGYYDTCFSKTICESFEWEDKRLKAGERALRVLWRIANQCYATDLSGRELALKMMDEHEACEEMMGMGKLVRA